ncbi:hypothetical protein GGF31_004603 [Allomyces arbusculus]|nr:hypothetical protein GGF31_004603 [Allomyces arbusculus]
MAPTTAGTPPLTPRLAILYGSQTGNAESIARGLHDTAVARGFDSSVHCLNDHAAAHLDQVPCVLFITSSTGDGEPPDNANLFFRALRKLKGGDKGPWPGIKYALLGLGDTNYSNFCGAAKRLEKRVSDLGATRFYASAFADDATGLEETIDPWVEGLWPVLETVCARKGTDAAAVASTKAADEPTDSKPTVDSLTAQTASLSLTSTTPAPALYSPPALPTHTIGHLTIPGLPDLSTVTSLTGLPAATVATVRVTRTTATKPIRTTITDFHAQWHSRITRTPLPPYTSSRPATASVRSVTSLTTPDAVKSVLALDMDLPSDTAADPGWAWVPGDAFGVLAPVPYDLALATAARLGGAEWTGDGWVSPVVRLDGVNGDADLPQSVRDRAPVDAPKSVDEPAKGHYYSIFDLCRFVLDVTATPKKALLRALGDVATVEAEKKLLYYLASRAGTKAYRGMADHAPTLLHVLATVPSVRDVPLEVLLAHVIPLAPRLFSHTSTPLAESGRARLSAAVGLVDFALPNGEQRTGVASDFVRSLQPGDQVPVYPCPSARFHLPADLTVPVVLVGAGTGIAPLAAFVRHRHAQREMASARGVAFGSVTVVQGLRDPTKDWLFGAELAEMSEAGTVTAVHLAVSRVDVPSGSIEHVASVTRGYVQDAIRTTAARDAVVDAIENGGRVYVCGDAKGMGRGVMDAVAEVLGAARGVGSKLEAVELVAALVKEGRYLQDLW